MALGIPLGEESSPNHVVGSQSQAVFCSQIQSPSPSGGDPELHTGLSLFSLAPCQGPTSSRAPGNQEHGRRMGETQRPASEDNLPGMPLGCPIPSSLAMMLGVGVSSQGPTEGTRAPAPWEKQQQQQQRLFTDWKGPRLPLWVGSPFPLSPGGPPTRGPAGREESQLEGALATSCPTRRRGFLSRSGFRRPVGDSEEESSQV